MIAKERWKVLLQKSRQEYLRIWNGTEKKPAKLEAALTLLEERIQSMMCGILASYPLIRSAWIVLSKLSLLLIIGIMFSCTSVRVGMKYPCPAFPAILPVKVENGTLSKKEVDNVISNWQALWAYAHQLRQINCKK